MKISELPVLSTIARAAQIPVAISGENRSISLGGLLDSLQNGLVYFESFVSASDNLVYADGSTSSETVPVWDESTRRFYGATGGNPTVLYSKFEGDANYYSTDTSVRRDCLFIRSDGMLYAFNGESLVSVGLPQEQAEQLRRLVPIEVASEAELERLQAEGKIEKGQIYYIPETE